MPALGGRRAALQAALSSTPPPTTGCPALPQQGIRPSPAGAPGSPLLGRAPPSSAQVLPGGTEPSLTSGTTTRKRALASFPVLVGSHLPTLLLLPLPPTSPPPASPSFQGLGTAGHSWAQVSVCDWALSEHARGGAPLPPHWPLVLASPLQSASSGLCGLLLTPLSPAHCKRYRILLPFPLTLEAWSQQWPLPITSCGALEPSTHARPWVTRFPALRALQAPHFHPQGSPSSPWDTTAMFSPHSYVLFHGRAGRKVRFLCFPDGLS